MPRGKELRSMSPTEQKVYFALQNSRNDMFDINQIRSYRLCSEGMLRRALASLVAKGWLTRVKNGLYAMGTVDQFRLGPFMFNGYAAFSSALYLYNAFDEVPSVVYVANENTSASRMLGNMEIRAVALGRRAIGIVEHNDYVISGKGKTLYDCFYMPENSGGYINVLRAITLLDMRTSDWKEFIMYVNMFEGCSFRRKVGYMLDVLNRKAGGSVPHSVINGLHCTGNTAKLGSGRHGHYVKEWNIMDYVSTGALLGFE